MGFAGLLRLLHVSVPSPCVNTEKGRNSNILIENFDFFAFQCFQQTPFFFTFYESFLANGFLFESIRPIDAYNSCFTQDSNNA